MSTCPCGNFVLPKSFSITIHGDSHVTRSFLHENNDIYISTGQKFTTISPTFSVNNIYAYSIILPSLVTIENQIKVTLKSYNLNRILAILYVGTNNKVLSLNNIDLYGDSILSSLSLNNDRIILEIESICEESIIACCDRLPSSLTTSCLFNPCELCLQVITTTPSP